MYEKVGEMAIAAPRDSRLRSLASALISKEQSASSLLGTKFFRTSEIAAALNVHQGTVLKWVRLGLVQAVRTGPTGRWRISEQELIRLQKGKV
jgi:excisionase family DNA binding protein